MLCVVVCLLALAVAFLVWLVEPWNPLGRWNCMGIKPGMTRDQVEAKLQKPPDTDNYSINGWAVRRADGMRDDVDPSKVEVWEANGFLLLVGFDVNGRVTDSIMLRNHERTFRQKVQKWLGWWHN